MSNYTRNYQTVASIEDLADLPGVDDQDDLEDLEPVEDLDDLDQDQQTAPRARRKKRARARGESSKGGALTGLAFGVGLWFIGFTAFQGTFDALGLTNFKGHLWGIDLAFLGHWPKVAYIGLTKFQWDVLKDVTDFKSFLARPWYILALWFVGLVWDMAGVFYRTFEWLSGVATRYIMESTAETLPVLVGITTILTFTISLGAEPISRYFKDEFIDARNW